MVDGVRGLVNSGTPADSLFDEGKDSFEANCDYCKTAYLITRDDLN
jgi:redox-regulated HSP33 family molecular chaperone